MEKAKQREQLGKEIILGMYHERMILTWLRDKPEGWKLADSTYSPYYVNMRHFPSHPELYRRASEAFALQLEDLGFSPGKNYKIVGIAMAGIPFSDAMSLKYGYSSLYTRKLPDDVKTPEDVVVYKESHGQHALVEGDMKSGDRLIFLDDLVTSLGSKLLGRAQALEEIKRRNLNDITSDDFVVLLDREQGAAEKAKSLSLNLSAFIPFVSQGIHWLKGEISKVEYEVITGFMKDRKSYQDPVERERLAKLARG